MPCRLLALSYAVGLKAGAGSLLLPTAAATAALLSELPAEPASPSLEEALESGTQIGALRAVAVVRDGQLVAGRTYGSASADALLRINSVTKSVSSMLIGIALGQGRLRSLSQTLGELLPESARLQPDSAARDTRSCRCSPVPPGCSTTGRSISRAGRRIDPSGMHRPAARLQPGGAGRTTMPPSVAHANLERA